MLNHFSEPQLFIAGFTLLLGFIFALAAFLEFRTPKHPPLRSVFCAGFDRDLLTKIDFSQPEIPSAGRRKVFADIDDSYLDSSRDQTASRRDLQASLD